VKQPISHLIAAAAAQQKKADKIAHLQHLGHHFPAVKDILQGCCDPRIKFLLPSGETPYKPSQYDEPGILYAEVRRLYIFAEGGSKINRTRREQLWIELLQNVHRDDAVLLDNMKDKKLPEGLKAEHVLAAFPNLF
jgi:hypothetical protein